MRLNCDIYFYLQIFKWLLTKAVSILARLSQRTEIHTESLVFCALFRSTRPFAGRVVVIFLKCRQRKLGDKRPPVLESYVIPVGVTVSTGLTYDGTKNSIAFYVRFYEK